MEVERLLAEIDRKINKIKKARESGKRVCSRCYKTFIPLHKETILCELCQRHADGNDLNANFSRI